MIKNLFTTVIAILVYLVSFTVHATNKLPRVALVVGNSAYQGMPLANPVNDARSVASTLESLGFIVHLKLDADQREIEAAIDEFADELHRKQGVGLFFYAGHGVQAQGENYLIPVKARLAKERDLRYEAVNLGRVLDAMEAAGNGLNIIILDACRNNPLTRSFRSANRGLAKIGRSPNGLLIAFSTAPGEVAADGEGKNSPYTEQLVKSLQLPNKHVLLAFQDVATKVQKKTNGKQVPWTSNSLTQDFYFKTESITATDEPIDSKHNTANSTDVYALWESVKNSGDIAQLSLFIDQYGAHPLAEYARLQRNQLKVKNKPAELSPVVSSAIQETDYQWSTIQDTLHSGGLGPLMTVIPTGQFMMGADNGQLQEQPVHPVNITRRIAVSRYEVTFAEFDRFAQAGGLIKTHAPWSRNNQPVINVSWQDAIAYTQWLSAETGYRYRLPSESEWEYFARANSDTRYFWGDHLIQCPGVITNEIDRLRQFKDKRLAACVNSLKGQIFANCLHCFSWAFQGKTVAVNEYSPNHFGLFNILGNVAEFVQDCWRDTYYGAPVDGSARQGECTNKVARGGHWNSAYNNMTVTSRESVMNTQRSNKLGIRLVRELD